MSAVKREGDWPAAPPAAPAAARRRPPRAGRRAGRGVGRRAGAAPAAPTSSSVPAPPAPAGAVAPSDGPASASNGAPKAATAKRAAGRADEDAPARPPSKPSSPRRARRAAANGRRGGAAKPTGSCVDVRGVPRELKKQEVHVLPPQARRVRALRARRLQSACLPRHVPVPPRRRNAAWKLARAETIEALSPSKAARNGRSNAMDSASVSTGAVGGSALHPARRRRGARAARVRRRRESARSSLFYCVWHAPPGYCRVAIGGDTLRPAGPADAGARKAPTATRGGLDGRRRRQHGMARLRARRRARAASLDRARSIAGERGARNGARVTARVASLGAP